MALTAAEKIQSAPAPVQKDGMVPVAQMPVAKMVIICSLSLLGKDSLS